MIAMEPHVENKYLMLEELGGVLRQLSIDFPGRWSDGLWQL